MTPYIILTQPRDYIGKKFPGIARNLVQKYLYYECGASCCPLFGQTRGSAPTVGCVPTFCYLKRLARGMLLHAVQQAGELIEVAGIDIEVEHVAVAIEELVGWPAVDVQMTLNGGLLFVG